MQFDKGFYFETIGYCGRKIAFQMFEKQEKKNASKCAFRSAEYF